MHLFCCRNYSSEEECTIVDDDDDAASRARGSKRNSSSTANAKRPCLEVSARNSQSLSGIGRSGRRMGVNFSVSDSDDGSDEDQFDRSIPQRKRMR